MQAAVTALAECTKPVIAAVSGWCIGGGLDLIAAADIRLASEDAKFSLREAKVAIVADIGSLQRLPGIIGEGNLRELAFTAKDIDAARAERMGLVNEVFADQEAVLAAAHAMAREIASNPPLVVQGIKDVLEQRTSPAVADGLRYCRVERGVPAVEGPAGGDFGGVPEARAGVQGRVKAVQTVAPVTVLPTYLHHTTN